METVMSHGRVKLCAFLSYLFSQVKESNATTGGERKEEDFKWGLHQR